MNSVVPGDSVITSGTDSLFPKGLHIGTITAVSMDGGSDGSYAVVTPSVDFLHLEEVFVLREVVETDSDTALPSVGGVQSIVLRDRQHLAQDGMIVVIMTMSTQDGSIITDPEIITRGFVYVKDNADLMDEMRRVVYESIESCERQHITDWAGIKGKVKTNLSGYLYKATRRSPMILPVIMEV